MQVMLKNPSRWSVIMGDRRHGGRGHIHLQIAGRKPQGRSQGQVPVVMGLVSVRSGFM